MKQDTYNQHLAQFQAQQDGRFPRIEQLPCLTDDDSGHDYCPIYLHHTFWAANVLAQSRPKRHIDIGSLLYFVAIASAIVPIDFYDIRKVEAAIPSLRTGVANLTNLPFETGSVESISSLHSVEHVGLGRYGDALDVTGDLKAASELKRIVAPGGQLLMVLPVGQPKVCFNAHRIYSYEQVLEMFSGLTLKEFTLFDPPQYIVNANPERVRGIAEGAGCFWFVKQ